jgi:hypothetical protein
MEAASEIASQRTTCTSHHFALESTCPKEEEDYRLLRKTIEVAVSAKTIVMAGIVNSGMIN